MYGNDHQCEVSRSDLSSLEYDARRQCEQVDNRVDALRDKTDSLQAQINELWEVVRELQENQK